MIKELKRQGLSVSAIRPPMPKAYERRFETAAGEQAQVDFAEFQTEFTSEPGVVRKVWLFSMVQPHLLALPAMRYDAVLTIERRVSHEGMVSVAGNYYSVPDTTRRRVVEVQHHPLEVQIFEEGELITRHPVLEGKNQRRVEPGHRKAPPPVKTAQLLPTTPELPVAQRPLAFYG